jgi:hypothetical protein
MEFIFLGAIIICCIGLIPKSKKPCKKFGEGLLTDRPDSGNLNIWKY